jgi:hypothetical protein
MAKDIKTNIVIGGKIAKSLQKAFGQSEKGVQQLERAYQKTKAVGVKAFQAVGLAVTASVTALTAAAESTREFRQDLNKMYTNAEKAKLSLAETDKALSNLYSVSGEFDSANEALSNLIATGYKGKDLEKVIEAVNGASIKWQDTIKSESLADAIQESLASGELTGQFSEVMARSGADVKAFGDKLKATSTLAERQQLVLNWLAKSGLAEVNSAYRENNKELVAAYESDLKYQKSLAKVGEAAEPLATILKGGLSGALSMIATKLQGVDFDKVAAAMDKVGKMGSEAFNLVWETLSKIDWESVINSGVSILGIFTKIFNFIVGNWSSISPLIYGIVAAMVAYKAISIANSVITAYSTAVQIANAFASSRMAGMSLKQAASTAIATAAQAGLNLAFLACPITWIVLGIGLVVAAIALIAKKVGGFKELWSICWDGIKTAFSAVKDFIIGGLQAVVDFIQPVIDWVDKLLGKMGGIGEGIKKAAKYTPAGLVYSGIKKITGNALGSTVTKPTLTWVGEGGDTETIVPHNNKPRSQALALEAVKGTGVSVGGNTFVFSPTVYAGGMSETKLRGIMNDLMEDFKAKMSEYTQNEERLAY